MILILNQNIGILEYYREQLILISGSVMLPLIFINKIKIDNMEIKQETLEEAAEKYSSIAFSGRQDLYDGFIAGAKWQAEKMYSEEEVFNLLCKMPNYFKMTIAQQPEAIKDWFEQFKKQ